MTIEALLQDIADTNRAILVALQSGAAMATAEFAPGNLAGTTASADESKKTTRKRRTNEEIAADEAAATKNGQAAATPPVTANTEPSATASADTVSGATSAGSDVTWDAAVAALKKLAQDPKHGSTAVLAVIKQIDPTAANVPALKALNKNTEIVAAIDALLNPAASTAEADPLFG